MAGKIEQAEFALTESVSQTDQALSALSIEVESEEDAGGLPEGWALINPIDCFDQISTTGKKVKTKECKEIGLYPVIDQGQDDISGYIDDPEKVIPVVNPICIFGDHTRVVKWVTKDFVPGADGTKVLSSNGTVLSKFGYYLLRSLEVPDKGYSRHFKYLKELDASLPPLAEQTVIAQTLDTLLAQVDNIKTRLDAISKILKTFRQSVLAAAVSGKLTEEWRGGNECETPEVSHDSKLPRLDADDLYSTTIDGWIWTRLGSVSKLINGDRGKNYPNKSEYVEKGIPFINTGIVA